MITRFHGRYQVCALLMALVLVGNFGIVSAEDASSSDYKITDTQFGSGSVQDCSTTYCANGTAGDLTAGSTSSPTFKAEGGSDDGSDADVPLLEVIELGGVNDLGTLSTTATATASSQLKVLAYNISGYTVEIAGTAPNMGSYVVNTPSSPTASLVGTEQFGVNLVANTDPSVGANPVQVPDTSFSYGEPTSNYDTPNKFMYNNGDEIASSTTSSGETDYTVSMIMNISENTPGGQYTGNYNAVVVPVY
jgi:hypothetical protein